MTQPSEALVRWLAGGERGISSNTIVEHLTGLAACRRWHGYPHDPSDLARCVRLLEACPELAARLDEMRSASPVWAALVGVWPELVALLDVEIPGWRERRSGHAPRCYARMAAVIDAARATEAHP